MIDTISISWCSGTWSTRIGKKEVEARNRKEYLELLKGKIKEMSKAKQPKFIKIDYAGLEKAMKPNEDFGEALNGLIALLRR